MRRNGIVHRADFGRKDAEVFIREVLPEAPDVPMQVAHAGGWGGFDPPTDGALAAFADALESDTLGHRALYFDLSAVVRGVPDDARSPPGSDWWPRHRYRRLAERMRQIGLERFLFGTDWPDWSPSSYRRDLAAEIPLGRGEIGVVLGNHAPWLAAREM